MRALEILVTNLGCHFIGVDTKQHHSRLTTKPNVGDLNNLVTPRAVDEPFNRKLFRTIESDR